MITIPALRVQVHVEPGRMGSPESHTALPRIDTPRFERGQQAQAAPSSRDAGPAAGGQRPPVGSHAAGRRPAGASATPASDAGTIASTLPDAYISTPRGDLQSDLQHAGVLTDEAGQRYVAAGNHYYAVRNDPANGTWRVVQPQDPAKPGIPIGLDPGGQWRVRHDVGLAGGRALPTRAQIENDLRQTQATLEDLLDRRFDVYRRIRDTNDLIRRYDAFQVQTRADRQAVRTDLDFWQGMFDYFTTAVGRDAADPSFQTTLEQARLQIERKRNLMHALQRMIDEHDTHLGTLRSRIDTMNADLEHIRQSVPRTNQRIRQLAAQLNDFE